MGSVLSVRGYSKSDGKEILYLEPFWWKKYEFKKDSRVKEKDEDGFLDYEATLSAEELGQMHEHFKQYLNDDWYKTEGWQKLLNDRVEIIDWAINEGASEFSHFIVGLYSWDSGM